MIDQEELYAGVLHGNCKHSGFGEYDNLTGYVTKEYTMEWTDRQGTRWRKTCRIINLGRPDRGIPVDPDEAMTPEQFEIAANVQATMAVQREAKAARAALLVGQVQECIQQHGAQSASACAKRLGVSILRVADTFKAHPELFRSLGRKDNAFGLVGVEYAPPPRIRHRSVVALRDFLMVHGPSTAPQAAGRLKKKGNFLSHTMKRHPDWFCVVEILPRVGQVREMPVWGVVGVHDKVSA
jgi:hypothetical protein